MTTTRQPCWLPPLGEKRALSSTRQSASSETGSSVNSRTAPVVRSASVNSMGSPRTSWPGSALRLGRSSPEAARGPVVLQAGLHAAADELDARAHGGPVEGPVGRTVRLPSGRLGLEAAALELSRVGGDVIGPVPQV